MGSNLENLVELAKEGDREALKDLLLKIKDRVFGLAVRMLGHPMDAERVAVIYRNHPDYVAPETFMDNLKELMNSDRFELFNGQQ